MVEKHNNVEHWRICCWWPSVRPNQNFIGYSVGDCKFFLFCSRAALSTPQYPAIHHIPSLSIHRSSIPITCRHRITPSCPRRVRNPVRHHVWFPKREKNKELAEYSRTREDMDLSSVLQQENSSRSFWFKFECLQAGLKYSSDVFDPDYSTGAPSIWWFT